MSKQKFAVFDIDGTLIRWQLYHVIVSKLAKRGALGQDVELTLKQALMAWKRREDSEAFKSYELALVAAYENALQNISTELFDSLINEVIEEYKDQTYTYTRNLARQLKADGYKLFIISGSHAELIEQIAKYYDFDDWLGTHYERDENGFTGKAEKYMHNKDTNLQLLIDRNDVTTKGSIAIGDTRSDIAMLQMVENPIAFNPDQNLLDAARENGWKVVVERKSIVYELEAKDGKYILV